MQFYIRRQNHENVTTELGDGECSFCSPAQSSDVEQIGFQLPLESAQSSPVSVEQQEDCRSIFHCQGQGHLSFF